MQWKVGNIMIWFKRLVPFLLIVGIWFGYHLYSNYSAKKQARLDKDYALVTARVWVASAKYRDYPEQFIKFRDSLLESSGLTKARVNEYIKTYEGKSEKLGSLTTLLKTYVDSLLVIEDSLSKNKKEDSI